MLKISLDNLKILKFFQKLSANLNVSLVKNNFLQCSVILIIFFFVLIFAVKQHFSC